MIDLDDVRPAGQAEPLIDYLRRRLPPNATSVEQTTIPLPDDNPDGGIRFMAGATDGIVGHHAAPGDDAAHADRIVRALAHLSTDTASDREAAELYRLVADGPSVLGWIDALTDRLRASGADVASIRTVGRWLVSAAAHREVLKLGIVLCGLTGAGDDDDVILVGGHEEFTLYVAVAVQRSLERPDTTLFELARRVHGWGRVHLVERLAREPQPDVRSWLLRGGYRNAVMDEYVAHAVAEGCGLSAALAVPTVDDDLFDGAGGLIVALLRGGPARDIDDLDDGAEIVVRYLGHQRLHPLTLSRVAVVAEIDGWFRDDADWNDRAARGWTPAVVNAARQACAELLGQPETRTMIAAGLVSSEEAEFAAAEQVAGLLGIDTFEHHMKRLEADALRRASWFSAVRQTNSARIDRLVDAAEHRLPLSAIATGPGTEMGLGPGFEAHGCLDFVLQDLGRFPGKGWTLVRTALESPVTRNRNLALRVLEQWSPPRWPPGVADALERAHGREPDAAVQARIAEVLAAQRPS